MGWPEVALAALNVLQAIALAWIVAWQQRARGEVAKLNGQVATIAREGVEALHDLHRENDGGRPGGSGTSP